MTVLAPESKESQACLCFSSLSVVQQDPPHLEPVGDTHQNGLGVVEELAL